MKKLTKKFRHQIYLKTTEDFKYYSEDNCSKFPSGLCYSITTLNNLSNFDYYTPYDFYSLEDNYPEMYLFTPNTSLNFNWWFMNEEGHQARALALAFMIEMSK